MVASSVLEVFRFSCFTLASCFRRAVLAHLAHLSVQRHDTFLGVFFFRSARVEDHLSMWAAFSRKASPIGTSPSVGWFHRTRRRLRFRFSHRVVLLLIRLFSTFVCSFVSAVSNEPSTTPRTRALLLSLSVDFVHSQWTSALLRLPFSLSWFLPPFHSLFLGFFRVEALTTLLGFLLQHSSVPVSLVVHHPDPHVVCHHASVGFFFLWPPPLRTRLRARSTLCTNTSSATTVSFIAHFNFLERVSCGVQVWQHFPMRRQLKGSDAQRLEPCNICAWRSLSVRACRTTRIKDMTFITRSGKSHLNKALLECFRAHHPLLGLYPLYWEKDANSFTFKLYKLYKRLSSHLGSAQTSNTVSRDHATTGQFHELSLCSVCHTKKQFFVTYGGRVRRFLLKFWLRHLHFRWCIATVSSQSCLLFWSFFVRCRSPSSSVTFTSLTFADVSDWAFVWNVRAQFLSIIFVMLLVSCLNCANTFQTKIWHSYFCLSLVVSCLSCCKLL